MPENLKIRRPADEKTINIHEPCALRVWANHFNVSEEKIKEVVWNVGPMVKDVKQYLRK